jgi:hypothetical protein
VIDPAFFSCSFFFLVLARLFETAFDAADLPSQRTGDALS